MSSLQLSSQREHFYGSARSASHSEPPRFFAMRFGPLVRAAGYTCISAATAIFAPTCAAAQAAQSSQTSGLQLRLIAAYAVPDSFPAAGAARSASGLLVLWTPDRPFLLLVNGENVISLGRKVLLRPIAAAFVENDRAVEVVDGGKNVIVRLSLDDTVVAENRLNISRQWKSAARARDVWFIGGVRAFDSPVGLSMVSTFDIVVAGAGVPRTKEVYRLESPVQSRAGSPMASLTAHNRGVLVSSAWPPFETVFINEHGSLQARFTPPPTDSLTKEFGIAAESHFWVGLPVVPVKDLFVQTLADLRSDSRLVILFDAQGQVMRKTLIDMPLGFMSGSFDTERVLAARRISGLEIVEYNLRWGEAIAR